MRLTHLMTLQPLNNAGSEFIVTMKVHNLIATKFAYHLGKVRFLSLEVNQRAGLRTSDSAGAKIHPSHDRAHLANAVGDMLRNDEPMVS